MAKLTFKQAICFSFITAVSTQSLSMSSIANQCVDSSGFNTCWFKATSEAETCYQNSCSGEGACSDENDCASSNLDCVTACVTVAYEGWINCTLSSCWNQVSEIAPSSEVMH